MAFNIALKAPGRSTARVSLRASARFARLQCLLRRGPSSARPLSFPPRSVGQADAPCGRTGQSSQSQRSTTRLPSRFPRSCLRHLLSHPPEDVPAHSVVRAASSVVPFVPHGTLARSGSRPPTEPPSGRAVSAAREPARAVRTAGDVKKARAIQTQTLTEKTVTTRGTTPAESLTMTRCDQNHLKEFWQCATLSSPVDPDRIPHYEPL